MSDSDKITSDGPPDRETPPWLQPVPEEELEAAGGLFRGRGTLVAASAGALTLVGLLVAAMLYLYMDDAGDGPPVRVAAPDGPVKQKPEDRGGMDVAHRDKSVFDRAQGRDPAGEDDAALAPDAEEPVETLPESTPEPADPPAGEAAGGDPAPDPAPERTDRDTRSGDDDSADRMARIRETVDARQSGAGLDDAANDVAGRAPTPAAKPDSPETSGGQTGSGNQAGEAAGGGLAEDRFRVQLGAYSKRDTADTAWAEALDRFPDALADLDHAIEPVDADGRTLYRLRAGPLADRTAADQLCVALRAGQQACIVVSPS